MTRIGLALVGIGLLSVALTGCIEAPGASGPERPDPNENGNGATDCRSVDVPTARAGIRFEYAAEGRPNLFTAGGASIVTWGGVDPEADDEDEVLELPEGSVMTVAVGEDRAATYDLYGDRRPAYRAAYRADHPNHPRPIDFHEEWIDPETGALVKQTSKHSEREHGQDEHLQIYGRIKHVPLLFAPVAWDRALDASVDETVRFPHRVDYGKGGDVWRNLSFEGARIYRAEGACRIDVAIDIGFDWMRYNVTFEEDIPLPVRLAIDYSDQAETDGARHYFMTLREARAGTGDRLPAYREPGLENRSLPREPLEDGFLADRGGVFPTDFDRALEEARKEERLAAWLQDHPDARIVDVRHVAGHPNSTITDRWWIIWTSREGDARGAAVTNETATPVGAKREHNVAYAVTADEHVHPGNGTYRAVPMDVLVDLHETVYDRSPEVLRCNLGEEWCGIGTHDGTHKPYACDEWCDWNYDGFGFTEGIEVWTTRGWIVREGAFGPAGLTQPVPR